MTTALTELIEWIVKDILTNPEYKDCPQLKLGARTVKVKAEKLLEKEKQQMMDCCKEGIAMGAAFGLKADRDRLSEQYYKENFESQH